MKRSMVRVATLAGFAAAAAAACGVEDRTLSYEYRALANGGQANAAGQGGTAPNAGDGGQPDSDFGAGSGALGGGSSDAGAPTMDAAGAPDAGAATGGASGGGNAGAQSMAGTPNTAGSPNTGGAPNNGGAPSTGGSGGADFPCGDLNEDNVDDCTQTLMLNSRFDVAASNWDSEGSTTQMWDARNGSGKPGSGSLLVVNSIAPQQVPGPVLAGSRQCIPVSPTTNYEFAARVMMSDAGATGQAGLNVLLFDDDACQGNIVTGNTPLAGGVAGSWTVLRGKLWVPGGVHSMYVRLVAIRPFPQASLGVLVDDVLVVKRQ